MYKLGFIKMLSTSTNAEPEYELRLIMLLALFV